MFARIDGQRCGRLPILYAAAGPTLQDDACDPVQEVQNHQCRGGAYNCCRWLANDWTAFAEAFPEAGNVIDAAPDFH